MTPVWSLWPHWATVSTATSPWRSTTTDTQVNMTTSCSLPGIQAALRVTCFYCPILSCNLAANLLLPINKFSQYFKILYPNFKEKFSEYFVFSCLSPACWIQRVNCCFAHLYISGDRAARLDGTGGAALALYSCANAPPLGQWWPESRGQRTHHQRTECRCRGMFKHSSL